MMIPWLSGRLKRFAGLVQRWCPHRRISFVADAWDYEYACHWCDRRWMNEVPLFKRLRWFQASGEWYVLCDGKVHGPFKEKGYFNMPRE